MQLSVIIIGRNEELHIRKCIQSVLKGTEYFENKEIFYVDSASTDQTIEIAKQYPISIVKMKAEWPLSASAGRFIGTHLTKGQLLFFIDGDTILYRHWLTEAFSFLKSNPHIGGVAGIVHEVFENPNGQIVGKLWNRYGQKSETEEVSTFGGIALYRRSVLNKAGTFNPYLTVDEERELAFRIQRSGFKLMRIQSPMAITYGPPRESMQELLRRSRSHLYKYGITLKYCLAQGFFKKYLLKRLRFVVTFLMGLLAFLLLTILLLLLGHIQFLPFILVFGFLGMVLMKKGRLKSVVLSLMKRFVYTFQTLISFFTTKIQSIDSYPKDVIIIKNMNV